MARIGYARVSTREQNTDSQVDELERAGCARIFVDKASGKTDERPEWEACLAYLRAGDELVITRLSRAMRSIQHLLNVVNGLPAKGNREAEPGLRDRGIGLRVLKQDIDTTTASGRLVFHIMAAIDEFQRELIVEATNEGLKSARARGRVGGRKPVMTEDKLTVARRLHAAREMSIDQIAATVGVSRSTLYSHLRLSDETAAR